MLYSIYDMTELTLQKWAWQNLTRDRDPHPSGHIRTCSCIASAEDIDIA